MQTKKLLILISALGVLLLTACGGGAEEPAASEEALFEEDFFSFTYPADLAIRYQLDNVITVATTLETANVAVRPNPTYNEGEGSLTISTFAPGDATPMQYLETLDAAADGNDVIQFEAQEEFTTYGSNGVAYTLSGSNTEGKIYAFQLEDGAMVVGRILAAPGEFDAIESRLLPILGNVTPNNPPTLTLAGGGEDGTAFTQPMATEEAGS